MSSFIEEVLARRIVPVVVVRDAARAAGLAAALVAGNLPIAEVTLRTPAAPEAIATMARQPGLLVGAGTVLTPDQVDLAVDAGAQFLVSPGYSAATVARRPSVAFRSSPGRSPPAR